MNIKNRSKVNGSKGKKQRKTKVSRKKAKKQKGGAREGTLINEDEKLASDITKLKYLTNERIYDINALKFFLKNQIKFKSIDHLFDIQKYDFKYNKPNYKTETTVLELTDLKGLGLELAASQFNTYVWVIWKPQEEEKKGEKKKHPIRNTTRIIEINGEDFTKGTETKNDMILPASDYEREKSELKKKLDNAIKKITKNVEIKYEDDYHTSVSADDYESYSYSYFKTLMSMDKQPVSYPDPTQDLYKLITAKSTDV